MLLRISEWGQLVAVERVCGGREWQVVGEAKLAEAIQACRVDGAKLVIAKLDRPAAVLTLGKAGVDFVCADMPNANQLTMRIMAMIAAEEREMISKRTKAALAAAERRGTQLGGFRAEFPARRIVQRL